MEPPFRGVLSRAAARVLGSRFAKPVARVALAVAGLALLAFVGRTAIAGAVAGPASVGSVGAAAESSAALTQPSAGVRLAPAVPGPGIADSPSPTAVASTVISRSRASPDDPVILNAATDADLRRLPGVGAKRAEAILALRSRLGRFRALEDLLKVKGIGRATLKRLRPLVRLDPPPSDGGSTRPPT